MKNTENEKEQTNVNTHLLQVAETVSPKWLSSVIDRIWKLLHSNGFQSYGLFYDEANQDHIITLYGAAHDRNGPFKKPRKPGKIKDYTSKGKKGKQRNKK